MEKTNYRRYSEGTIIQSYIDKGKIGILNQDDVELTFIELRMQLLKMDKDDKDSCVNLLKLFIDNGMNDNLKCILDVCNSFEAHRRNVIINNILS